MSGLVLTEVIFRMFSLSTFERYYQLAQETIVERVKSRRWEVRVLIGITFYIGLLHLMFLWHRPTSPWLQMVLFDMVSLFGTVFHFDFIISSYFLMSTYTLYSIFFSLDTLFTRRWITQIVQFEDKDRQQRVLQLSNSTLLAISSQWLLPIPSPTCHYSS